MQPKSGRYFASLRLAVPARSGEFPACRLHQRRHSYQNSGMTFRFEQAQKDQFEAIKSIYLEAFARYAQTTGRDLATHSHPWFQDDSRINEIWIATDETEIVGFIIPVEIEASFEIEVVCVNPSRQKQGIGSFLLDAVESMARARGLTRLSLHTTKVMTGLIELYEKHGFRIVREGPPHHGRDNLPRVYMEKEI